MEKQACDGGIAPAVHGTRFLSAWQQSLGALLGLLSQWQAYAAGLAIMQRRSEVAAQERWLTAGACSLLQKVRLQSVSACLLGCWVDSTMPEPTCKRGLVYEAKGTYAAQDACDTAMPTVYERPQCQVPATGLETDGLHGSVMHARTSSEVVQGKTAG